VQLLNGVNVSGSGSVNVGDEPNTHKKTKVRVPCNLLNMSYIVSFYLQCFGTFGWASGKDSDL